MAHPYSEHRADERARANKMMGRCGYARGGAVDEAGDKRLIKAAVHKHEEHDHPGKPLTKLKKGGDVEGGGAKVNLAKRARGGRMHKGKGNTKVQVIVAPQGGAAQPHPVPVPVPMRPPMAGGAPMPPPGAGVPPGMPPGGMMPPGAGMPPGAPPMMRARGGKVHMEAGAGSGEGRIEKMHEYGEGGFKPKKIPLHA